MRVVQTQSGASLLVWAEAEDVRAGTEEVRQCKAAVEVQIRFHFHFNFTVQFKSPYSLSSNFIFSISNITISF